MLKILRFDFYKIFHSKVLLGLLIFTFCCTLINPVLSYVINDSTSTVYSNLMQPNILFGILWIFAVPFAAKDISSNYVKNLVPSYSEKDKVFYILSKVVYIVLFCLAFMLLSFLVEIVFNYIFGAKCMYDPAQDNFTVGQFYLQYICGFWNYAAMGTLFLFLSVLLKKEYIVLIIVLPYLFILSSLLYGAVNALVGDGFSIEKYTIFGIDRIVYYSSLKESWSYILTSTCYIAVFSVLSWLVFRKRSF